MLCQVIDDLDEYFDDLDDPSERPGPWAWLPEAYPHNVKVVLTVHTNGNAHKALQQKVPADNFFHINPLVCCG